MKQHIERLKLLVLVVGFLILGSGMYLAFHRINASQRQLNTVSQSQVNNRVSNVASWCNGINTTRQIDRAVLAHYHATYPIPLLDCKTLEAKTRQSAH